jgi:pimeloyl-ACP methyl ester carboxylesterase
LVTADRSACDDAVIVIPGIMGSELVDTATGSTLWGLADPRWYLRAWTSGSTLEALRPTDDELAGRLGRIKATRLLTFPAFAPMLRGFEPYGRLLDGLRSVVRHPAAVLPFAYDWRLPVVWNAQRLAEAAEAHLRNWRAHPAGSASAGVALVAHSMGGLIATYFITLLGGDRDVRTLITIGTPFRGSIMAAQILNTGRGAPIPLPRARLRKLAATMPGLHDLLPSYRCVTDGTSARRLTPSDVAALGGDRDLAAAGFDLHDRLGQPAVGILRTVVGVEQPTAQSMTIRDGVVTPQRWAYLPATESEAAVTVDRGGDGTVYRDVAGRAADPAYFAQTHGALAATVEVVTYVRAVLTEQTLGPWLGVPATVGVELPDLVSAGESFTIAVPRQTDPAAVTCHLSESLSDAAVAVVPLRSEDGQLRADVVLQRPGLYRIAVKGQGLSAVTQLIMVLPPAGEG